MLTTLGLVELVVVELQVILEMVVEAHTHPTLQASME
jgi:hypothetical protein